MGRQWGNTDDAANSVLWAATQVNLTANTINQTALYGNTTIGAFNNNGVAMNQAVGQFGLDVNEISIAVGNTAVAQYVITSPGSGYNANAAVTVANTTGGANTLASNSTQTLGRITAVTANGTTIRGYTSAPTVTIAAPASINIVSNTAGFSNTNDTFVVASANSRFAVGDRIYYAVPAGNTAIAPLTANTFYYVQAANTSSIKLAAAPNGPAIDLTDTRNLASPETHTIVGDTATAVAVLTGRGYTRGAAHTGWILRTVGTGGRAGRVQYETLVAFGGNFSNDGSDDAILHDA
jgi:hypothetical protein